MNFLRNLIQGSTSAAKTGSADKKKGPAAAGGLGGPPPDSEGHRETVITQENTRGNSPPLSPASTHSDTSLPGLSPECDSASTEDDTTTTTTTTTPCVTCVSELPSSVSESPPHTQGKTRQHDSLGNSDSEYESAEELDSHSSPQSEEDLQAFNTPGSSEAQSAIGEECVEGKPLHLPLECHTDLHVDTSLSSSVVNVPAENAKTEACADVILLNGFESEATETAPVTTSETTLNTVPESTADATLVTGLESEQPVSTVCETLLTVTKNEIAEESLVENTVLIDQQVITTTHTSTSPETDKPVDVSEINFDLVTSGDNSNIDDSEPATCVSVDLNETKETCDPAAHCGESEHVSGQITDEASVSEATSKPEDTLHPSGEERTPTPYQETDIIVVQEKQVNQDTTVTQGCLSVEEPKTCEETSTVSPTTTESREASPPLLPPPDPDDIPIPPTKSYNLDFLDNLDDPNFNPFTSSSGIRNTPPPSPEPGCKLPPLKPTIKKKTKKPGQVTATNSQSESGCEGKVEEKKVEADPQDLTDCDRTVESCPSPQSTTKRLEQQEEGTDQKDKSSVLEISLDDNDTPTKAQVKPLRKPPQRKPIRKTPLKPRVTEKNNNLVEKENENQVNKDDEDLPIPPSKGYNLDFLDNLDDANFNPFASKTAVRNSPPSSEADFPASQNSFEKLEEPKAKVVVAKKPSPQKGFTVPRKTSEVNCDSSQLIEDSTSQPNNRQESVQVPETCKSEPSHTEANHKEEEKEEELPLPKQGYNLDFLDDPNFDPFQSRSSINKVESGAKGVDVKDGERAVINDISANDVVSNNKVETVVNNADVSPEKTISKPPESVPENEASKICLDKDVPENEASKICLDKDVPENEASEICLDKDVPENEASEICLDKDVAEPGSQEPDSNTPEHTEEDSEPVDEPKNQPDETPQSQLTKDINQTTNQNQEFSSLPDSENNWNTERTKTPSIGSIGQLDSLEFDQLLEHEASRLAEEFMNCSRNSGVPDYDQSPDNHYSATADMSYSNVRHVDENVNLFQRSSQLANSPPLGKRGAVCGAESTDPLGLPFSARRAFKRDIVVGEERLDTSSFEDDSGIVVGSRSDLETEVNHSEAGPEIATGLTSSDLRCASQFFREATDLENNLRRSLVSPLLGSHSKLSGDVTPNVTPTKDKKEPPAGAPESPQNKPTPSTSSPAPPPREERSAPEGTSSPSPRPNDTAERKSLSTRPTSAPPEGYMTASEVQELLKRQELKFEEKLLRVELAAGEKEKKLQQTMKDEQKELTNLGSSVTELTQSRDALLKMVAQFKGMLATLVAEKEKEKKAADEKISSLQGERDQALEDLANVEVAFSDVHRKYERTKQVVDTLKRNEETLRGAVADYEAKLKKQEQKFLEFQKHAEEKIQMANEEFESMRKSNEQEMTKMAALLKKAEMKIMSLQDSFDRKTRENQELTQLCDDLINKVGTSH